MLDIMPPHYTDQYYFRLETKDIKYSYPNGVNITVRALPSKPQLSPVGPVKEGTQLTLTCRASAPCPHLPPTLTWTPLLGNNVQKLEKNKDGTMIVLSVLNVTVSSLHHKQMVTCTANYSLQKEASSRKAEQSVSLEILYSPKNTTAFFSPSGPVEEGALVTLQCTSDGNPPVKNYTWFQVQEYEVTLRATGKNFTICMTATTAGFYYCEAQNQHGTQISSVVNPVLKGE
ncbi:myelin-associated glycoprotein-like isoform X1 [Arapaima gigas]